MSDLLASLRESLLALDIDGVNAAVEGILAAGAPVNARDGTLAVADALQVVGRRFQEGEWFVAELVYAGEIARSAMDRLTPALAPSEERRLGTIVAGTVAGDLHDLGKNLFLNFARSSGFEVVDLGVNVPAERFLAAVRERRPLALGLSCLLTVTAGEVRSVIESLRAAGLREQVKVIVGGAALTEQFGRDVGADAFAPDAVTGTDIVRNWSVS